MQNAKSMTPQNDIKMYKSKQLYIIKLFHEKLTFRILTSVNFQK